MVTQGDSSKRDWVLTHVHKHLNATDGVLYKAHHNGNGETGLICPLKQSYNARPDASDRWSGNKASATCLLRIIWYSENSRPSTVWENDDPAEGSETSVSIKARR